MRVYIESPWRMGLTIGGTIGLALVDIRLAVIYLAGVCVGSISMKVRQ